MWVGMGEWCIKRKHGRKKISQYKAFLGPHVLRLDQFPCGDVRGALCLGQHVSLKIKMSIIPVWVGNETFFLATPHSTLQSAHYHY